MIEDVLLFTAGAAGWFGLLAAVSWGFDVTARRIAARRKARRSRLDTRIARYVGRRP